MAAGSLLKQRKVVVAALSSLLWTGYEHPLTKWWFPETAGSCSTHRQSTGWKSKKASCSLYLNELPGWKCKFRDQIMASKSCFEKHSPRGSQHHDERRCERHTCSEPSYRISMWNATDVQKTATVKLTRGMKLYIYKYNHSRHWPYKPAAINYMSPPSCVLNAPRGGTIYIYMYLSIYKVAGTGTRPRFPSHSCPTTRNLHCVW